jgi:PTH1 family peptidyl-tRNA hydrolase
MKLIVGLGNPGHDYQKTRHNAGFLALDALKKDFSFDTFNADKKLRGEFAKGKSNRQVLVFLKPTTFMNESGVSVQAAMHFYKLNASDILVIQDDKDIPLGETRVQVNRGPAGHNGIRSIIEKLGTQDFARIRIGVAPIEKNIIDTADFVLGNFSKEEFFTLKTVFDHVASDIKAWLAK